MFSIFNRNLLLATIIALGTGSYVVAQSNTKEVAIDFEAWVGDRQFACGESYEEVGTSGTTITPTDFRFYISDVTLIDENGNVVPVELEQDEQWQYQSTALLDFEDGSNGCDNGTPETNTTIVGTVPEGNYQSLQFTLGVPEDLNHEDAAIAPSPLNLTSMWWNWQGGYKFLRLDLETDEAIAEVSQTSYSYTQGRGEGGNVQINRQTSSTTSTGGSQSTSQTSSQTSIFKNGQGTHSQSSSTHTAQQDGSNNAYIIHLGSTGCSDSAQSNLFGCANPNRVEVILEDFDPEDNVVVADLAELLAESDLAVNEANTPLGCMSSPDDADCMPIMESLGLSSTGAEQMLFWVE